MQTTFQLSNAIHIVTNKTTNTFILVLNLHRHQLPQCHCTCVSIFLSNTYFGETKPSLIYNAEYIFHFILQFHTNKSFTKLAALPLRRAGGRLNKKDGLTRYGDSHVKDKTS